MAPKNLHKGPPDSDGSPTYFTLDVWVPPEWQWRHGVDEQWQSGKPPNTEKWLQVREPSAETIKVSYKGWTKNFTRQDIGKAIGYATSEAADRVWDMLTYKDIGFDANADF